MKYKLALVFLCLIYAAFSQKAGKLNNGDPIPRVIVTDQNNKTTKLDLPSPGNMANDRFVLVYFYSLSSSTKELVAFNNQIEHILSKYKNNACKGASDIEYVTICIEKDYSKWQKSLIEANYTKSRFTGKQTHYLDKTKKAFMAFKGSSTPSLFLVNPKRKLYVETDSFQVLEATFQNVCRVNASSSTADLSGKILMGEKNKVPLTQHNVYLIKAETDTIKRTETDNFGDFVFKQVDTTQNLSIHIEENSKVKGGPRVYLAKQNGELVSEFKKNVRGTFEYKLLKVDVQRLAELEEDEDITMKYKKFSSTSKKNLTVAENVYYDLGKYTILIDNEIVLDKVITILKASTQVKLEVISHTDSQGDDASNLKLSENRSSAVIDYLVSKGIDRNRLKSIGKGETEIRNRCFNGVNCSDKEQEYNRRTEFKFIKN